MLQSLHVKNLALMEETEISFGDGLNILSGETGAGKSILLGALHLALGGKVSKEMLRHSEKEALAEAVFLVTDDGQKERLKELDIDIYDDEVILTRKITDSRSVARINGETVPAVKMRDAGAILLDIYGQREHQSLLRKSRHMELLDDYAGQQIIPAKDKLKQDFISYRNLKKEWSEASLDEGERAREIGFLEHEVEEIANARLLPGEDEALEADYRRVSNLHKITEALQAAYGDTGAMDGASDQVGRAIRQLHTVEEYDERVAGFLAQLSEIDALLGDCNRELSSYMDEMEFDPRNLEELQNRLNLLNLLKTKYGATIGEILRTKEQKEQRIDQLRSYDAYLSDLEGRMDEARQRLEEDCAEVSRIRRAQAERLCALVAQALRDLNFLDVSFSMEFQRTDAYTADGYDDAQFMISTNPGEPMKALCDIASGGEMSRIMLAIKTVMAEKGDVDTLIFDEIDSGISGRTAQAVSEKLSMVAKNHQIICITHLPQIAAMARHHYLIEKKVTDGSTVSHIYRLDEEESVTELARMLGGSVITDTVLDNAREMKSLADVAKK